jgi:hypothetical protein
VAALESLTSVGGSAQGLSVLHQRLETHFYALRTRRDEKPGPGLPIFALEHGMGDTELSLLKATVREAVLRRHLPRNAWLPFVVHAAEIGYEYSGDEYWQTFSARTPGWAVLEDRAYIRSSFQRFARQFGGAEPSGRWAHHFSIICWPITHAVLPTDLQQQLVQLIFEYRTALTSDLLADPVALGTRLAARSGQYSSRFQYFTQNTSLLGQVAAALLAPDNEVSPYLLDSTQKRIVETLSAHQQARMWLRDAKSSANRVRTHGFRPAERSERPASTSEARTRLPPATDPGIVLQLSEHGWGAHMCLPDLSELSERFPSLHEHLGRLRVRLAGTSGAPLARRRLLVPGQQVPIEEWPDPRTPLLQFEGEGMEAANRLLADQCVLSPGPVWLFRVREPGLAAEVRGKFVRPGHSYVLLTRAILPNDGRPTWMVPTACVTAGASAYAFTTPAVMSDEAIKALRTLGLGVVADVEVRPAGVVPGGWDGEGAGEWLASEDVILAIRSTRAGAKCALTVDDDPTFLDWPEAEDEIFVGLSGLSLGPHDVQVALLPEEVDTAVATGSLLIGIRAAHARPSTGTLREGLLLLANPAVPTLSELWDGRAIVELLGPLGAEVTMTAALERARGVVLARTRFKVCIPVDSSAWLRTVAREMRGSNVLRPCYNEAEALVLAASHPDLGTAQLRCERGFTPLRWVVGSDRDGPYARLINNVDSGTTKLTRYEFVAPAEAIPVDSGAETSLRWPAGGLLRARVNDFEASVILPPHVRDLTDLRETRVVPQVAVGPRTPERVEQLIALSNVWTSASLPGDSFAHHERRAVLRTLTARLVSIMAGGRWAQLEERGARDNEFAFQRLKIGVGEEAYQQGIAEAIQRRVVGWEALEPGQRAVEFAAVLGTFKHRTAVERAGQRFAELLLRMASEPGTLAGWPNSEVRAAIDRIFVSPVLIRAARFVVLAIHLDETEDTGAPYEGWPWG